jgi:malonate transporter
MPFESYLQLAFIVLVGFCSGKFKLFNDLENTIDIFNRFSLYIGFPVLMFESLINKEFLLPSGISFYMVHIISILLIVLLLSILIHFKKKNFKNVWGAIAIGSIFGNIAYLGIPICTQIVDKKDIGIVSLGAAIHLVIALSLGQFLLIRWNSDTGISYKKLFNTIIRQPLIWAPIAGLLFRIFPQNIINLVSVPLAPISLCAGPISLYLLGLYLYSQRKYLAIPKQATFIIVLFKMILLPLVFSIISLIGFRMNLLTLSEVKILILQASMPLAITTFSLSYQYKAGQELIAQSIVITTFLSFLIIPFIIKAVSLI